MDTLYNPKVSLIIKKEEYPLPIANSDDIKSIDMNLIPDIKEYDPIFIKFHCLTSGKLYIEELEIYSGEIETENGLFNIDKENKPYYLPKSEPFYIYKIENKNNLDPLIPGFYEMKIVVGEKNFYTWIRIVPKNMEIADWEIMKNEIENTLAGLSMEVLQRKSGFQNFEFQNSYDPTLFKKIDMFVKESKYINNAIEMIINNPKFEIQNYFNWTDTSKKSEITMQSIQVMMKKPHENSEVYSIQRKLNHDISINRNLKVMAEFLFSEAKKINKFLSLYIDNLSLIYSKDKYNNISIIKQKKNLDSLNEKKTVIKRVLFNLKRLLIVDWLKDVDSKQINNANLINIADSRYSYIKKFYLSIQNQKENVILNRTYEYYWKQSAQLYEIWGYIKMIEILKIIKFEPVGGWIFDDNPGEVPFLNDNDFVLYKRGELEARLVFNEEILRDPKKVSLESPLYTARANNKPDFHLDLFKHGRFLGSIVCDTKYRSLYNIWFNSFNNFKTQTQIRNYRDIQSPIFLQNKPEALRAHIRPVSVWIMFPISTNKTKETQIENEDHITFQELNPRTDIESIAKKIDEKIQVLETLDNDFYLI